MPDPDVAQVRSAIERVKKAQAALIQGITADPRVVVLEEHRAAMEDATDSYLLQIATVARLLDKWEPVTVQCETCAGSGRTHGKVLVSRCGRCQGKGVVDAVDTAKRD